MNKTETKAKRWLERQGKSVVFQRNRSPDFIDGNGGGYEVKLLRSNAIAFSRPQFEGLKDFEGVQIVVYDANGEEPVHVVPFHEIVKSGKYWKNIRISVFDVSPDNTSIQLKSSTMKRLAALGKKGDSYNDIIKRLLEEHDRNSGTH